MDNKKELSIKIADSIIDSLFYICCLLVIINNFTHIIDFDQLVLLFFIAIGGKISKYEYYQRQQNKILDDTSKHLIKTYKEAVNKVEKEK